MPNALNHKAARRPVPCASLRATSGAAIPAAMSPRPAGRANSAGRWPRAMMSRKATPSAARNVCGSSRRRTMPGAVRARATTGIRRRASSKPRKPATATGIHGTPWPSRVWYQP